MTVSWDYWRARLSAGAMVGLAVLWSGAALAINQGYPADTAIAPGSLVSLTADASGKVVPATQPLVNRLLGVVVAPGSSTVSLNAADGQVEVATDGIVETFVSTAGGDIKTGDYITLSPIAAVGMKGEASGRVAGIAQEGFSSATPGTQQVMVGTGSSRHAVTVGEIAMRVGVTTYAPKGAIVTVGSVIQGIANSLAGKPVATARLFVAMIILLAAVLSASILLYVGVRTSIVAVGRNPLAKSPILSSLTRIIGVVLIILAVAGLSIWWVIA